MAIFYALAMAIYMKLRGLSLGHNLEMSGVTVAVGVVLAGAYWLGVIQPSSVRELRTSPAHVLPRLPADVRTDASPPHHVHRAIGPPCAPAL
jgi:hypothetical protein